MKSKIAFTADVSFLKNNKNLFFNKNEYIKEYTRKAYYYRKVRNETRFPAKVHAKNVYKKKL